MSKEEETEKALSQADQELEDLKLFIDSRGSKGPLAETDEEVIEEEVIEEEVTEEETKEEVDEEEKVEEETKLADSPEDLTKKVEEYKYYNARREQALGEERKKRAELEEKLLLQKNTDLDEDALSNDALVRASLARIREEEEAAQSAADAATYSARLLGNQREFERIQADDRLGDLRNELETRFENLGADVDERLQKMNATDNWVANTMNDILASKLSELQTKDETARNTTEDVIKRKESASVVSGSGNTVKVPEKRVEDMEADEYLDHIKSLYGDRIIEGRNL